MANRAAFAPREWYHCYNRGVDKRNVFRFKADYERFMTLMYIANGSRSITLSDRHSTDIRNVLSDTSLERGDQIVRIAAYALMPNHVHFVLQEISGGGISRFMQRLFTGYTLYFNRKFERTGTLFGGAFKSKHVADDLYLKRVMSYVLINPSDIFDRDWYKHVPKLVDLEEKLLSYPYASTGDFFGRGRLESKIVDYPASELYDRIPKLSEVLTDAGAYLTEIAHNESPPPEVKLPE